MDKNKFILLILISVNILLATSFALADTSNVSRTFNQSVVEGGGNIKVTISVVIIPNNDNDYYLIDEIIPDGFSFIDSGGGNSSQTGHVKWAVLSNTASVNYTYIIKAPSPATATTYSFSGVYIIQGMINQEQIQGQKQIIINIGGSSSSGSSSSSSGGDSKKSSSSSSGNSDEKNNNVAYVENKAEFKIINLKRFSKESVEVIYSIQELSGLEQDVELEFLLLDSNNNQIAFMKDSKQIPANSKREFNKIISINSSLKGTITLLIKLNSETYSASVGEELDLSPSITGFTLFGNENSTINTIMIILFIVCVVVLIVVIRKFIQKKN